jgi:hypothetical protein
METVTMIEPFLMALNPQTIGAVLLAASAKAEQMALSSSRASLRLRDAALILVSPQGVWVILTSMLADWLGTVGLTTGKSWKLSRARTSFGCAEQKRDPGGRN